MMHLIQYLEKQKNIVSKALPKQELTRIKQEMCQNESVKIYWIRLKKIELPFLLRCRMKIKVIYIPIFLILRKMYTEKVWSYFWKTLWHNWRSTECSCPCTNQREKPIYCQLWTNDLSYRKWQSWFIEIVEKDT